jgi:serine/threonine protein phosphatase 1
LTAHPPERTLVIGLGDYVDRGPDSFGVLDLLVSLRQHHDAMLLKGNHEALFLGFLEDPSRVGPSWFRNGGWETLVSYDVDCSPNTTSEAELTGIRDAFLERIPQTHLAVLNSMAQSATVGDYYFVHAGARPGVPLAKLQERDALWIRDGFADRDEPFEKIVVHGHSPVNDVFVGKHRINLDTGAYATGKLTCIVLQGDNRRFLEVAG